VSLALNPHIRTEITEAMVTRWREDLELFAKDCLVITNKESQLVPFVFHRFQHQLWLTLKADIKAGRPSRLYLLKARQMGSSTFVQALIFWRTVLWKYSSGLVVAHHLRSAQELFRKSHIFYNTFPAQIRPETKQANRHELLFARDTDPKDQDDKDIGLQSRLSVTTAKDVHLGASQTLHAVHLSEFARYENVQSNVGTSLATLIQTVPKRANSFVILETTAWGLGFAYQLWRGEDDQGNKLPSDLGFRKMFVSWIAADEYTSDKPLIEKLSGAKDSFWGNEKALLPIIESELKTWYGEETFPTNDSLRHEALCRLQWRREKIAEMGIAGGGSVTALQMFQQEYPTTADEAFLTTGRSVFDTYKLDDYRQAIESSGNQGTKYRWYDVERGFEEAEHGELHMFVPPEQGRRYVIGADVSEGLGEDRSVAQVLKLPELEQVAVFKSSNIDPLTYADALYELGDWYNRATIGVESNSVGIATNLRLSQERFYRPLYRREIFDNKKKKRVERFGWNTNRQSKAILLSDLRDAIQDNRILFNDVATLDEMGWYIFDPEKNKYQAAVGYHDDCVMSLGIAYQLAVDSGFGRTVRVPRPPRERKRRVGPQRGSFEYYEKQLNR